jgi:hypothetical protein
MNNDNSKPNTLFSLLDSYKKVEIPIIQRDYVHGRDDVLTTHVRETFLTDIFSALGGGPQLDLGFIYGRVDQGKFIPIDGQQRLTTLYLLHIYASCNDECSIIDKRLIKFSYETRKSSRQFFENLVSNRKELFNSSAQPSEVILDSKWFHPGWIHDPTIKSSLTVLDSLDSIRTKLSKEFRTIDNLAYYLYQKDYSIDEQPIVFHLYDDDKICIEDTLYIRFNARGMILTPMQVFKARLINRMQTEDQGDYTRLCLDPGMKKRFSCQLDLEWTNLFWDSLEESGKNEFDKKYLMFFSTLCMNQVNCKRNCDDIFYEINDDWVYTLQYNQLDTEFFETAYYTLNYLSNNDKTDTYKNVYGHIINLGASSRNFYRPPYFKMVMFHAITKFMYLTNGEVQEIELLQWNRIFNILVLNSRINSSEDYRLCLKSIESIAIEYQKKKGNILEDNESCISDNTNVLLNIFSETEFDKSSSSLIIHGFAKEQVQEERIKANIILTDGEFANEIKVAESHKYFRGQINPALHYSYSQETEQYQRDKFVEYWEKIELLFDRNNSSESKRPFLIRRALLTFGDYPLSRGPGESLSLCIDKPNDLYSIKVLFRNHGPEVKNLLDSIGASDHSIEDQLQKIIDNSKVPESDWRYSLIKFEKLYEKDKYFHWEGKMPEYMIIRKLYKSYYIISKINLSSMRYDIFLSGLYENLIFNRPAYEDNIEWNFDDDITKLVFKPYIVVHLKNGKFIIKMSSSGDENSIENDKKDYTCDSITEATDLLINLKENKN